MSKSLKRSVQLSIVAMLMAVNFQLAGRAANEAVDAEFDCINIFCPINQDICWLSGGQMSCYWSVPTQTCEVSPCMPLDN